MHRLPPAATLFVVISFAPAALGQCAYEWSQDFQSTGIAGRPLVALEFDDGSGPALFVGGGFAWVDGVLVNHIAKWDGVRWHALGSGVAHGVSTTAVTALAVFDDGNGPALYAGGLFTFAGGQPANNVARWNRSTGSWSPLGDGLTAANPTVGSLVVHDLGNGPRLVAGGTFTHAGGVPASNIAAWNGSVWEAIGAGTNGHVREMHAYQLPNGTDALFVTGSFTIAGGIPADRLSYWNELQWHSPNFSFTYGRYSFPALTSLAVFQGALLIGGDFRVNLPQPARNLIRFDGNAWTPVDRPPEFGDGEIGAMRTFGNGADEVLYASGIYYSTALGQQHQLTRWDGQTWGALGGPLRTPGLTNFFPPFVDCLAAFDDGGGPRLYAGGNFSTAGGKQARNLARLIDNVLVPLHPGAGVLGDVQALAAFDDGGGPAIFTSGGFAVAGDAFCSALGRWDGATWAPLAGGVSTFPYGPERVPALHAYDPGGGPGLYVGGSFRFVNGTYEESFARWQDGTLTPIPNFPSPLGTDYRAEAMAVFPISGGPRLVLGGRFEDWTRGIFNLAAYDGTSITAFSSANQTVNALAVIDDPEVTGDEILFAGGEFTTIGTTSAMYVARYDWMGWESVGGGLPGPVYALALRPGTNVLFAGGTFGVARFNGTSWVMLTGLPVGTVHALAFLNDGSGTGDVLFAGGEFDGLIRKRIGQEWVSVDGGLAGTTSSYVPAGVYALLRADEPRGPALYAGGRFDLAGDVAVSGMARYARAGPAVIQPPTYQTLRRGETADFSVVASGNGPITHQWRFESQPLIDGGRISGATTDTLTVASLRVADAGRYDVVLTDDCGQRISQPALLRVTFTCAADLDSDGSIGLADLATLLSHFGGSDPQPTDGDIDEDGDVDLADLSEMLGSFGSNCP